MKYFILSYIKSPIGDSEDYKNIYNFTFACKVCGTGARLVGKLKTKGLAKNKKDFFETLIGDYIISESLYKELVLENIKLGNLMNVVDSRNKDLPFYHLYTDLYFPKSTKNEGLVIEGQCDECKRNGFFGKLDSTEQGMKIVPIKLYYSLNDNSFLNKSDFFFSWECLGLSNLVEKDNNVIGYARPLLIVSNHLKTALIKFKVPGLNFEQIEIR